MKSPGFTDKNETNWYNRKKLKKQNERSQLTLLEHAGVVPIYALHSVNGCGPIYAPTYAAGAHGCGPHLHTPTAYMAVVRCMPCPRAVVYQDPSGRPEESALSNYSLVALCHLDSSITRQFCSTLRRATFFTRSSHCDFQSSSFFLRDCE
jgi:hypothetical protein